MKLSTWYGVKQVRMLRHEWGCMWWRTGVVKKCLPGMRRSSPDPCIECWVKVSQLYVVCKVRHGKTRSWCLYRSLVLPLGSVVRCLINSKGTAWRSPLWSGCVWLDVFKKKNNQNPPQNPRQTPPSHPTKPPPNNTGALWPLCGLPVVAASGAWIIP